MNRPALMGIVNCTPDSFSGDGSLSVPDVLARIDAQLQAGASIIDLGAESTRPGAEAIGSDEEWRRLAPVLAAMQQHPLRQQFRLSLDSYRPATVAQAIAQGIDIVNDVTGLRNDAMLKVLASWKGDVVVMHALSVPVHAGETLDPSIDAVAEILHWKQMVLARAMGAAVDPARLIFDPGIGFGKTAAQSLALLARAGELVASGGRWLIGHSRKSYMKAMLGEDAGIAARDDATLVLSAALAQTGVHILRVHDVARHRHLLERLCM